MPALLQISPPLRWNDSSEAGLDLVALCDDSPAPDLSTWKISELDAYVGGLSEPSKMPGYAYSLPAEECITGSKLRSTAGSICQGCYAMKGRYQFPVVKAAMYRRLATLGSPLWCEAMAELIERRAAKHPFFRWHDSGDLQSLAHLRAIVRVCELSPSVQHWIPTREYRIVSEFVESGGTVPVNLNIRLSVHMIGGHVPTFPRFRGVPGITISTVSRTSDTYPGSQACVAPLQANQCGSCRACWDRSVPHVDYHLH